MWNVAEMLAMLIAVCLSVCLSVAGWWCVTTWVVSLTSCVSVGVSVGGQYVTVCGLGVIYDWCLCGQSDVIARLQPLVGFRLDSAGIADNLCKVEVFYEQFDYESIEESEAYPVITPTIESFT